MASRRKALFAWSLTMSTTTTTTHALPPPSPPSLSARDTCTANSNLTCPKDSLCISLAGDTTILCCPANVDCDTILPIVCDISQQDPAKFPNAPIKTSLLDDDIELEQCGDACCPFGFSCSDDENGKAQCIKNDDQSKSPKASVITTTTASLSTPTSLPTVSSPTTTEPWSVQTSTPAEAEAEEADGTTPKPKLTSIIGGVIGGCLILLILAVIILLYIRRRRHRRSHTGANSRNNTFHEKPSFRFHSHSRSGSNSNSSIRHLKISEPIVQADSYRTDFLLKSPSAASSISNRPPVRQQSHSHSRSRLSIPNPFSSAQSPAANSQASFSSIDDSDSHHHQQQQLAKTGMVRSAKLPPIRNMKASSSSSYSRRLTSSAQKTQRHPAAAEGENIDVFADPITVAPGGGAAAAAAVDDRRITTFSDMMAQADLGGVHRGERYVPGATPRI